MSDAIIGVYGTVLGVSIGSLFTYLFAKDLSRRAAIEASKQTAASEFRGVFAASVVRYDIAIQEEKDIPYIDFILKEEAVKQALVFEKFKWFVKSKDRNTYQEAWDSYYADIFFHNFSMEANCKKLFTEGADKMLEFTKS